MGGWMPNHVQQKLVVNGLSTRKLGELKKFVKGDDSIFSAQKIWPMPEEIRDTASPPKIIPDDEIVEALKKWFLSEESFPYLKLGRPISESFSKELIEKYGANNWYTWSCDTENYGTKWGIYDVGDWHENEITFQSAWSPATSIIRHLSNRFPKAEFILYYADEGGGFVGYDEIHAGCIEECSFDWGDEEGKRIRTELGYGDYKEEI